MKDALQSDHQSELEGQLLLAEIRHQKELDRLRMELSGAAITASASGTPSTGRFVMYHVGKKRATEGAGEAINSDVHPCIPSPSLMRGVRGVAVGKNGQRLRGVGDGEKSALGGGRRCLGGKLPSFKMPAPTAPPNDAGDKGVQQGKTKLRCVVDSVSHCCAIAGVAINRSDHDELSIQIHSATQRMQCKWLRIDLRYSAMTTMKRTCCCLLFLRFNFTAAGHRLPTKPMPVLPFVHGSREHLALLPLISVSQSARQTARVLLRSRDHPKTRKIKPTSISWKGSPVHSWSRLQSPSPN